VGWGCCARWADPCNSAPYPALALAQPGECCQDAAAGEPVGLAFYIAVLEGLYFFTGKEIWFQIGMSRR